MRKNILWAMTTILAVGGCNGNSGRIPETKTPSATPTAAAPAPPSNWDVSNSRDDVTGEETKVATDGYGDNEIIVRRRGQHLQLYVVTPDFLETTDNMESRMSPVAYKFDDGKIIHQSWTLSDDNTSLFYPGNPTAFLQKLEQSKSFAFQYHPAEKVPTSETFSVGGFPSDLIPQAKPQSAAKTLIRPVDKAVETPVPESDFSYPECDDRNHP